MREQLHTTPQVIANFHDIMGDNYRRTQPLNGREIHCCGESDTIN
jgi:carbonic anhydrase